MAESKQETRAATVLGQKYAYATISLVLGLFCFVNLAGLEKAVLAIIFGWLALKADPAPQLHQRRLWAKLGIGLGLAVIVLIPLLLYFFVGLEGLRRAVEALEKMSVGR